MLLFALCCLVAYLIGSIPFGYLVARMRGVNIFQVGSGNIGATNVGRILGRKFGGLVFLLDFGKGAVPVVLARLLTEARHEPDGLPPGSLEVAAGLAAFLGHLFPVFLGFRGGKGVATGTGAVVMLVPAAALFALAAWIVIVLAFSYVSLASVGAALVLAAAQVILQGPGSVAEDPRTWFCLLAAVLVVVKHRGNLKRLLQGNENRIKEGPFMFALGKVVHVVCLGLWFGSGVFFSLVAAPTLFARFEAAATKAERHPWFPLAEPFKKSEEGVLNGPREQGTRAAGYAVGPIFPILFLMHGVCGFAAVATALPWMGWRGEKVHRWRVTVILAALACVLISWPLENRVREIQSERHTTTLAYLTGEGDPAEAREKMREARADFGRWHLFSLGLNLLTLALVSGAMVLTAFLPAAPPARIIPPREEEAKTLPVIHEFPTEMLEK